MRYCVSFHFVSGREVRYTDKVPDNVDVQSKYDSLAEEFASNKFFHFVENDQLISVNMTNVAYVRFYEIKEDD